MSSQVEDQTIFSSFKPSTKNDWKKVATKELNGVDPIEKLSFSENSIKLEPYYDVTDRPVNFSFTLPSFTIPFLGARAWMNMPKINVKDEEEANRNALDALNNGADGILFNIEGNSTRINTQKLLNKIDLKYCTASFLLNDISVDWLEDLKNKHTKKSAGTDSPGSLFTSSIPNFTSDFVKNWNSYHPLGIRVASSHPVDEIINALSQILELADRLTDNGCTPLDVLSRISVLMNVDSEFFLSIAKLKALQFLWMQILEAYQVKEKIALPIHVLARAADKNSMVKNTTAGLSAVLGGCYALTVEAEEENNSRMVRVARNVSNILREESHLAKVSDPIAGSYYIDHLTHSFAQAAWEKIVLKP
jgi:methylmalonyl-CoA mutase